MGKGTGMGISKMIDLLRREFPSLQFGYFNRTRENFFNMKERVQGVKDSRVHVE